MGSKPPAGWLLDISYAQVTPLMARKRHFILPEQYWAWAHEAQESGLLKPLGPKYMQVDWSNRCQKPFEVLFAASSVKPPTWVDNMTGAEIRAGDFSPYHTRSGYQPKGGRMGPRVSLKSDGVGETLLMDMAVPCRKCPRCLVVRRRVWRQRIMNRMEIHPRTWFVTLTLHAHARMISRMRPDWLGKEVTRYFNRMRQRYFRKHKVRASFKYVVAFERHKDGTPHVHICLHEGFTQIPRRAIEAPWNQHWGFATAKLVDDRRMAAYYTSKYMLKNFALSRIRASLKY